MSPPWARASSLQQPEHEIARHPARTQCQQVPSVFLHPAIRKMLFVGCPSLRQTDKRKPPQERTPANSNTSTHPHTRKHTPRHTHTYARAQASKHTYTHWYTTRTDTHTNAAMQYGTNTHARTTTVLQASASTLVLRGRAARNILPLAQVATAEKLATTCGRSPA